VGVTTGVLVGEGTGALVGAWVRILVGEIDGASVGITTASKVRLASVGKGITGWCVGIFNILDGDYHISTMASRSDSGRALVDAVLAPVVARQSK
jgi:hypothetical protein